jgi:hypothetical protein
MTDADTIFRLVYRSHSRIPDADANAELGRILRGARTNNASSDVTGALMLYDHWFAQVLEGPKAAVRTLFERIAADPRHDAVEVHEQGTVGARVFSRWAMAHVGEHGHSDIPLTATNTGIAEAASWTPTAGQEAVLRTLRDLTRGYGIGA